MIALRPPLAGDENQLAALLNALGYEIAAADIRTRLAAIAAGPADTVLLAVEGAAVLGLIALHRAVMLQAAKPVARITTLVVSEAARNRGVGRMLVNAADAIAREAGCGTLELTTSMQRTGAHAFYRALGFTSSSTRFHRALG